MKPTLRRRLLVAVLLTLGPGLLLAYFGYRSVTDRERTLLTNYTATSSLIRDRLVVEIGALQASLRQEPLAAPVDASRLQPWLRALMTGRPWLTTPFVVLADGRIMTAVFPPSKQARSIAQSAARTAIRNGERAEQTDLATGLRCGLIEMRSRKRGSI